jgi:hypothetical protein
MDLLGGLSMGPSSMQAQSLAPSNSQSATVDLLGDLFGNSSSTSHSTQQPIMTQTTMIMNSISPTKSNTTTSPAKDPLGDLIGTMMKTSPSPITQQTSLTCYNKNGLLITLNPIKESAQQTVVNVQFSTMSGQFSNLSFQVAVPRVRI